MEQEYLTCKNGLTSLCSQTDNPIMQKLIAQPNSLIRSIEHFTAKDLEEINSLCKDCNSFEPRLKINISN